MKALRSKRRAPALSWTVTNSETSSPSSAAVVKRALYFSMASSQALDMIFES